MADLNSSLLFEGKNMPFSNEAEQSVLGAVLIDPTVINEVLINIKPDYFYIPQNRKIFEVISKMNAMGKTIDFVTVLEAIKEAGVFDDAGGKAYLKNLLEIVPSSKNINVYINIIRERYYLRSLITASRDIIDVAGEGNVDAGLLLDSAEQKIYEIRQGREVSGLKLIKDVIEGETFDRLSKISNPDTRKDYIGIPTGISMLDRVITGLNKSDLIILGARPGMGKTSFALNIATNVAVKANKTVCFFSLEMTRDQLAQRVLSGEAAIKSEKMRTGDLSPEEWTRLVQAGEHISKAPIYFDETSGITVPEMKAKVRRLGNVDLIIIDYLGLMQSATRKENRVQEVSDITRNLKSMAKELNVPIIACAQLSRATEVKGKSHKPSLSDLRESGSIEQDADIVLFLYRENYYSSENTDPEAVYDEHKAECIVAKNRHGETGSIELYWDGQYTRFTSKDDFR